MELKGNGLIVHVNPTEQPDEWLVSAAQEIADAAKERGLELPFATGAVAVEGALQSECNKITVFQTKETFAKSFSNTVKGYNAVLNSINEGRENGVFHGISVKELEEEFAAWFSEDKQAYVTAAQETDAEVSFTLVATPNVVVTAKELAKAAQTFGKKQPYETYVWEALYSRYTPEQLSGSDPNNWRGAVFSLIPTKFTPNMDGTVVEQRSKLAKLQAVTPDLKIPSLLEAVTYWQTLRSAGEDLADNTTFDRTYIRHFDLPEQRLGGWLYVPRSCVYDGGGPDLDYSFAQGLDGARVAVG